jgi:selenide,water dikinase
MSAAQLAQALSILTGSKDMNLLVGSNTADDAGVYRISKNTATVATVDMLTPVVSDPKTYGMIVAANSISDVYAMGGDPKLALNIVGFPGSGDTEALGQILLGGEEKAQEAGVVMMGGHTFVADEVKYGLAVFGYVHPDKIVTNAGARPDDVIVLTKPIGVGTLIQAVIEKKDQGIDMQRVVKAMTTLNRDASLAMRQAGAHAATDITGFGLAGHLAELAEASRVGIELHLSEIPVHKGTLEVLEKGVEEPGIAMNLGSFSKNVQRHDNDSLLGKLIFSSETSGGLAIVLPPDKLDLFREKYPNPAPVIGRVTEGNPGMIIVQH